MDQLKQILAVLKKYHFWILCSIVLMAFLGTWFMFISAMGDETKKRVGAIDQSYSKVQSITGVTNHPNDLSVKMMGELNDVEAEQVRLAWERRFREQEDVLIWPVELKPDFRKAVETLIPIETTVEYPTLPENELKLDFRNRYRDYIREEMPKLAEIIGAQWHIGASASNSSLGGGYPGGGMGMSGMGMGGEGEGYGGGMGMSGEGEGYGGGYGGGYPGSTRPLVEEDPIVVQWSQTNQAQLQAASFNWVRPTTLQMLYAQEDLWVLRSMMMVIKSTNGDADAQYNAAIKEIMTIDLGPAALGIKRVGKVKSGKSTSTSGYGEGYDMESGTESFGAGSEGSTGSAESSSYAGGSGGVVASLDPADNRYVDDKMEPLTGARLRTAMTSTSTTDAFLVVAKRMPVRLRVKMNVFKLPLLLCELANSDLPVEVRQVRINAPAASAGYGSGYGGGYGESEGGGGSMPGGFGASGLGGGNMAASSAGSIPGGGIGGGMGMGGGSGEGYGGGEGEGEGYGGGYGGGYGMGGMRAMLESPYDATVEVYGLIYIYNPVDPGKLGLDDGEEEDAGTPAAGTGTPADATGTPADATGTPADATGTPADATGTPADATGTPADATGTPADATGTPADATGTPSDATGTPADATGTPADATGTPAGAS